ncbi:Mth938-like domain-containing protein [Candidatus Thioglobus sp.]|nr:Mth938-like domain-containing protein [Candidatus Thioglobus sp.]
MEFTQQNANTNSIISFDESSLSLSHVKLSKPCFISSTSFKEISISDIKDISSEFLFPLTTMDSVDLLIIGTGHSTIFLSHKQLIELSNIGLGVECMNNTSACSSFNLLLGDLRKVGLLLI